MDKVKPKESGSKFYLDQVKQFLTPVTTELLAYSCGTSNQSFRLCTQVEVANFFDKHMKLLNTNVFCSSMYQNC